MKWELCPLPSNKFIKIQLRKSDRLIIPWIKNEKPLFFDIQQIIPEVFSRHHHRILHLNWERTPILPFLIINSQDNSTANIAPKLDFYLSILLHEM